MTNATKTSMRNKDRLYKRILRIKSPIKRNFLRHIYTIQTLQYLDQKKQNKLLYTYGSEISLDLEISTQSNHSLIDITKKLKIPWTRNYLPVTFLQNFKKHMIKEREKSCREKKP